MEGKSNITSATIFKKPLVIYKINTDKALIYAIKIIKYLLINSNVDEIYVENRDIIVENLVKFKESKDLDTNITEDSREGLDSTTHKIKNFDLGMTIPDICICLGGDGTTLWCNGLFKGYERPPFLTFNLGTLGYTAIYPYTIYKEVLDELYQSNKAISLENRSMLDCKLNNLKVDTGLKRRKSDCCIVGDFEFLKQEIESQQEMTALNDIIIEKSKDSNLISLKIFVNNEPLTIVKCDGLILSTSTGSTAYSLSAGGSIMHHDVNAMILSAICPHSLSFRPIIFPANFNIQIKPCPNSYDKVEVVHDGRRLEKPITNNEFITISLSNKFIEFIVLQNLVPDKDSLWKMKIIDQLGWNNAFQNYA